MQRYLPKFVLAAIFILVATVLSAESHALTRINSSVTLRQNSASSNTGITTSTTVKVESDKEKNILVSSTPVPTYVYKNAPTITKQNIPFSPTVSPSRISIITPTKALIPTVKLSITSTDFSNNEKKEFIMNAINSYRKSKGLKSVSVSPETCNFAKTRVKEISVNFNHTGFRDRLDNGTLPYKNWSLVTENLAMTSNYKNVVSMWITSSNHAENMRKDTLYVCVENYSKYYAYEGMRP